MLGRRKVSFRIKGIHYVTSLYHFPRFRWLYRPSYVIDGNFDLNHLKMRRTDDDVALRDGAGQMVTSGPYSQHLNTAQEPKQRSKCSNHKAVNNANADRHNLDSTGIGGCACARHGATLHGGFSERREVFFPRSVSELSGHPGPILNCP